MALRFQRDLDPLDLEIVERAFESTWEAVKQSNTLAKLDSDEELEAALRCELLELARFSGVSDPEALRDLIADLAVRWTSAS
jgi:hypothetical protein